MGFINTVDDAPWRSTVGQAFPTPAYADVVAQTQCWYRSLVAGWVPGDDDWARYSPLLSPRSIGRDIFGSAIRVLVTTRFLPAEMVCPCEAHQGG